MKKKLPGFVEFFADKDEKLYQVVSAVSEAAFTGGKLDLKTRLLIALALDAVLGAEGGVASLAKQAREAGADDEEIKDAIRVAYYVAGMTVIKTGGAAF